MKTYTQEELEKLSDRDLVEILLNQSNMQTKCYSLIDGILESEFSYNKAARLVTEEIRARACKDYIDQYINDYIQFLSKDELIPQILFNQTLAGRAVLRAHNAVISNVERNLKSWMIRFSETLDNFYASIGEKSNERLCQTTKESKIIN
jgi:hypothetical protein